VAVAARVCLHAAERAALPHRRSRQAVKPTGFTTTRPLARCTRPPRR
jgi:hypothetical protein